MFLSQSTVYLYWTGTWDLPWLHVLIKFLEISPVEQDYYIWPRNLLSRNEILMKFETLKRRCHKNYGVILCWVSSS